MNLTRNPAVEVPVFDFIEPLGKTALNRKDY